ncbi:MAG: PRC-barrel domain containing protein [Caldithrix sp.]|nr:PRC-barrel domain containing protein [Caldithrix sp.]
MVFSIKNTEGFEILAKDGSIGRVHEYFFDDQKWIIRYLIVDTGLWLEDRRVLLSPKDFEKPNCDEEVFPVNLSKKQIEESPRIEHHMPVSRQKELELIEHYDWHDFWPALGLHMPETALVISREMTEKRVFEGEEDRKTHDDPHLRSTREVLGYHIHATDGTFGHVADFLVNDDNWKLKYLVIDTVNWVPWSKKVLISPKWLTDINWADREVKVNLTKQKIKDSPEYHAPDYVTKEFEDRLIEHFKFPRDLI